MKPTLPSSLACFLFVLGTACGGAPAAKAPAAAAAPTPAADLPASTKADTKTDPAFAACHNAFKPASNDQDIGHDLDSMVKGCADATKMKKVGETMAGELSEKKPPVTLPLSVQAGKCYRVYGMSQSTMQDFDVALIDSTGALVGEDTTDDVTPVIAEDGKVCFKVSDSATLRASAGAGSGKYALQVWSD